MKANKWLTIKIIEDLDEEKNLKVGDTFLYGSSVVSQMEHKKLGHEITYYKVTGFNGSNIQYRPVIDILEEV